MTIYLYVFAFLSLLTLIMQARLTRQARLALVLMAYVVLLLFVGLRWETGNDWANYYNYYYHVTSLAPLHDVSDDFEIGYKIVSLGIKDVGFTYTGFLLIYSGIYLGLIFASFREENFRMAGWLILQLYSAYLLGLMGTARQVMSVAICVFSIRYLLSKDWRKFLLCIAIAASFHITALCFLLAWPLAKIGLRLRYLWAILAALSVSAALNGGAHLINLVGEAMNISYLDQKLAVYQYMSGSDLRFAMGDPTMLYYVKRLSFLLLFILCFRYFSGETEQLYFKLYVCSIVIFVLLYGTVPVAATRFSLYFAIFEIYLLAALTNRIKSPWKRNLYCVLLVVLCLSRLWSDVYLTHPRIFAPYKGVFINQDVRRDAGWF